MLTAEVPRWSLTLKKMVMDVTGEMIELIFASEFTSDVSRVSPIFFGSLFFFLVFVARAARRGAADARRCLMMMRGTQLLSLSSGKEASSRYLHHIGLTTPLDLPINISNRRKIFIFAFIFASIIPVIL
jgi:hypothetical protein